MQFVRALDETLRPLLEDAGFEFYDYSDPRVLGMDDSYFIDAFHGSDTAYLLMTLDMVRQGSRLAEYADASAVAVDLALRGISAPLQPLAAFRHTFSHFHLEIQPLLLDHPQAPPAVVAEGGAIWYNLAQPQRVGLAVPTKRILQSLAEE